MVQRYLTKPYLIDGLKFDLRLYVLIYGVDPLRIYIYRDGLVRFATELYEKPDPNKNMSNLFMHLTNYSINKASENFKADEYDGHKRSLHSLLKHLESEGHDPDLIMNKISDLIIKTVITV